MIGWNKSIPPTGKEGTAVKKEWKKIPAFVGALLLLLAFLPSALGTQTMYIMSANDKVLEYSADTMPFVSGGTVYVPYTLFIEEFNKGADLGIFYGVSEPYNTLSLYSRSEPILTFDRGGGNAYDAIGNTYSFRAIVRNGITFVPASAVCNYFGLQYSYLPNDYGVVIRVKKEGGFWLKDRVLISSANNILAAQKKVFDKAQAEQIDPAPGPTTSPGMGDKSGIRISFAFCCDSGNNADALLNVFEGTDIKALFFFRPDALAEQDDTIRRLLALGHRIGFVVDGDSAQSCLEQAEQGNRLLSHIARAKTDFLLVDGPDTLSKSLSSMEHVCWKGNINGIPAENTRPNSLSYNIMLNIEAKRSYGRILMDDSTTSISALELLIPQIIRGGYSFHNLTEVDLT